MRKSSKELQKKPKGTREGRTPFFYEGKIRAGFREELFKLNLK